MSTLDAKIEALEMAFVELAKFLGKNNDVAVPQVATALEDAAMASKANADTKAAVSELARRLR